MSYSQLGYIRPALTGDRRLAFGASNEFAVASGGQNITCFATTSQNFSSNQITWNIDTNNASTAICRDVKVKIQFKVVIDAIANAQGTPVSIGLYDAPRAFPLAKVTSSMQLRLNGATLTQENYRLVDALTRLNVTDEEYKALVSTTPTCQDYYSWYGQADSTGEGGSKNPLLKAGGMDSTFEPRGGWKIISLVNPVVGQGNPGRAEIVFEVSETLLLSPMSVYHDDRAALIGLINFGVTISFTDSLARVWSHSDSPNASTITAITATVNTPPTLLYTSIQPSVLDNIPERAIYSYSRVQYVPWTGIPPCASGASVTTTSNNIVVGQVPRRIIVWMTQTDGTKSVTSSDTFFRIDSVNITWGNLNGILTQATTEQLYNISREAGYECSFNAWNQYTGSLLVLDMTKSIMLSNPAEAPGISSSNNFQIQITATNLTPYTLTPQLNIAVCYDSLLIIENGIAQCTDSVLTVEDVAEARASGMVVAYDRPSNMYGGKMRRMDGHHHGGSFLSKVGKAAQQANAFAQKTHLLSNAAALTGNPNIAQATRLFGYGDGGEGGALLGGRRASRAALLSRSHY